MYVFDSILDVIELICVVLKNIVVVVLGCVGIRLYMCVILRYDVIVIMYVFSSCSGRIRFMCVIVVRLMKYVVCMSVYVVS